MRLLLDTHTFLWFIAGDGRLSREARDLIESQSNIKLISMASLWEMAVKYSIGKISLVQPYESFIDQQLAHNGIQVVDIHWTHVAEVSRLPFHHRDPFDRMIIAQGLVIACGWARSCFRSLWYSKALVGSSCCTYNCKSEATA